MKAIVTQGKGDAQILNVKEPTLRPNYVKVKSVAVALNPGDWKQIDMFGPPGAIAGCDFSGIVEEIGPDVKSEVQKGDRIFGLVHGSNQSNHEDGAFGEYLVVKDGVFAKVPDFMSMEDAATFGAGIATIGQALYQTLKLPLPTEPAKETFPILIYGGSTATGTLAIQLAKLSGLQVITTASKNQFEMLKSRGADVVFDYHDPEVGENIRKFTDNKLKYVLDTVSLEPTFAICAAALSTTSEPENRYAALAPATDSPREDVVVKYTMAFTALGEEFLFGEGSVPAVPGDHEHAAVFFKLAEKLIGERKLVPHPKTVGTGGLNGVLDGLQQMREDKVRGTKLVYRIEDTDFS